MLKTLLGICAVVISSSAFSQAEKSIPPGGVNIIAEKWQTGLRASTLADGRMKLETFDYNTGPVRTSLQLTVTNSTPRFWELQASFPVTSQIKKGDVLLAVVWARALTPTDGSATAGIVAERNSEPYTKAISVSIALRTNWQPIYLSGTSDADYAPEQFQVNLIAGYKNQTIEFGDLKLFNYGNTFDIRKLPGTDIDWPGKEANAPWRKAANDRIEKIRKANLTVNVLDRNGRPLKNAKVDIAMQKHAFGFGTAVDQYHLEGQPDSEKYKDVIKKSFNRAVIENSLKWQNNDDNLPRGVQAVDWLTKNGIVPRGHCIVWPGWQWLPEWLKKGYEDRLSKEGTESAKLWLRERIEARVRQAASATKGKVREWDVLNELHNNTDIEKILGTQILVDIFKISKETDPKAKLFLNDFGTFGEGGDAEHVEGQFKRIRQMLELGTPVEGIGMQAHFGSIIPGAESVLKTFDRFSVYKLPIQITEYDMRTSNDPAEAEWMRDFLTASFSHPSVTDFIMWGFADHRHWLNDAPLYDKDWNLKPSGKVYYDLVYKAWWTKEIKNLNQGKATLRAFKGDYTVTVKDLSGKTLASSVYKLQKDGTLTIRLK